MYRKRNTGKEGFTLIEMIVSVGLFAVVMLISVSALMSLVAANRKAQALQSVINNLNIAIDSMARSIREGSDYRCDNGRNCGDEGGTELQFNPYSGTSAATDDWIYLYDETTRRIYKSENGSCDVRNGSCVAITAPEVIIESLRFYVIGAERGKIDGGVQPKVMISIKGTAGTAVGGARTTFHVQTTAVQRVLDI